jgi:hypothetical protein
MFTVKTKSLDRAVAIANSYGKDGLRVEVRFTEEQNLSPLLVVQPGGLPI